MNRGATLISTVVALGLLVVTMGAIVHIYQVSNLAVKTSDYRLNALMGAESVIERMAGEGYAAVPEPGTYALADDALDGLPDGRGEMKVAEGPVEDTRTVTVTVKWQTDKGRPVSRVRLTRIFAKRGMDG
jgi:hypothetical protein